MALLKTMIVTGANAGIGFSTALALARLDRTRVVLVCRDAQKGEEARAQITRESGTETVELVLLDLASLAGVRAGAAEILRRFERIDVLVNNAGLWTTERSLTEDGIEKTLAVNHLGPFLLTNLLLERIKASAPARIVNVSSKLHASTSLDFQDIQNEKAFSGMKAYSRSKLANVLFTNELARRLADTGVTVNSLHPGVVGTQLSRDFPAILRWMWNLFTTTPEKGARTSVYLACAPEVEGVTGKYFDDCREVTSSRAARNEDDARRLWELSEQMVGLG